jgi:hypothetical protein
MLMSYRLTRQAATARIMAPTPITTVLSATPHVSRLHPETSDARTQALLALVRLRICSASRGTTLPISQVTNCYLSSNETL